MFSKVTITPFEKKLYLSSPTMHGEELDYIQKAYETNWMSTVGENIDEAERLVSERIGCRCAVALTTGTAALHMAIKLMGIKQGTKVFCSDLTFAASTNPIIYEGGIPVFVDAEYKTWNMDPKALERAFEKYPDVKHVVLVNLFGTPCQYDKIRAVCDKYGAVIIEDAAESLGASYKGKSAGSLGDVSAVSFNGNKIITGTSGGMVITNDTKLAEKVRKWSTQSRDSAPWYQHSELGYNYRMSNIVAGVIRGQLDYLDEHIAAKKAIYERYRDALKDLPVQMNPFDAEDSLPNYWLSCMIINSDAMSKQTRFANTVEYEIEKGKTCPSEILDVLHSINAEGRPLWKPMHLQPVFSGYDFIGTGQDVGSDLFERGLCLPSDIKMTEEQQDAIIEVIKRCFD